MTSATEYELDKDLGVIRLYRRGPAAKLELNRPERLNAWNEELGLALRDTVLDLAADNSVRAVLITGAGRPSPVAPTFGIEAARLQATALMSIRC